MRLRNRIPNLICKKYRRVYATGHRVGRSKLMSTKTVHGSSMDVDEMNERHRKAFSLPLFKIDSINVSKTEYQLIRQRRYCFAD